MRTTTSLAVVVVAIIVPDDKSALMKPLVLKTGPARDEQVPNLKLGLAESRRNVTLNFYTRILLQVTARGEGCLNARNKGRNRL